MKALWEAVKKGDKNAFIELYNTFHKNLYTYGLKITGNKELTKDCVQQLFMEVWDRREHLNSINEVEPYLLKYLKRKLFKEISKRSKEDTLTAYTSFEISYEELLIENQSSEQLKQKLSAALSLLTKKQKQVIKMKFFEGLTYQEIAEINGSKTRTIYNQVSEGLKILKDSLLTILTLLLLT